MAGPYALFTYIALLLCLFALAGASSRSKASFVSTEVAGRGLVADVFIRLRSLLQTYGDGSTSGGSPDAYGSGLAVSSESTTVYGIGDLSNRNGTVNGDFADVTEFPFQSVGLLKLLRQDGTLEQCTGALIAPNVVLTAASCEVDLRTGSVSAAGSTFSPGYTAVSDPALQSTAAPVASWIGSWVPPAFTACGIGPYTPCHADNDFAVLRLNTTLPTPLRFSADMTGNGINVTGYPGGLPGCIPANDVNTSFTACRMTNTPCDALSVPPGHITGSIPCPVPGGLHGAPMWLEPDNVAGPNIRGIVNSLVCTESGGASWEKCPGGFTTLSQETVDLIGAFIANPSPGG